MGGLCERGFLVSGVCPLMFEAGLVPVQGFGGQGWGLALADGAGSWQQLLGNRAMSRGVSGDGSGLRESMKPVCLNPVQLFDLRRPSAGA